MAKVLGKGLEALIKTSNIEIDTAMIYPQLSIKKIVFNKNQPRRRFDAMKMDSLTKSISKKGILQPLTVRRTGDNEFELIAGERRLRAAIKAGLSTVPAYVINIINESEMMELALIENIQRVDLNPMEEAEGYAVLQGKYGLTQAKIALSVSKSRSEITNKLRLLKLPTIIQEGLKKKDIEYGHARALLGVQKLSIILAIYKKIIKNNLNVRQAELLTKLVNNKNKKFQPEKFLNKLNKLERYLETKISINKTSKQKGEIIIEFMNQLDLDRILKKIYE